MFGAAAVLAALRLQRIGERVRLLLFLLLLLVLLVLLVWMVLVVLLLQLEKYA